jgi:chromosome segregation ATPase
MADENKAPEGAEGKPEGDAAKLKADLERLQAEMKAKDEELAKLESIRKEAEQTRQAAKEREKKALEEQGQFKALAEQQASELEELKKSISETQTKLAELQSLKDKADAYDAMLTKQRADLMAQLTDEDDKKALEGASLEVLQAFVKRIGGDKGGASNASPAKPPVNGAPPDFSKMTEAEQMKYGVEHGMSPAQIVLARQRARQRNM